MTSDLVYIASSFMFESVFFNVLFISICPHEMFITNQTSVFPLSSVDWHVIISARPGWEHLATIIALKNTPSISRGGTPWGGLILRVQSVWGSCVLLKP